MIRRMTVVGIDGCRTGWCCVALAGDGWRAEVAATIDAAWEAFGHAELILIDIPIGLKDAGSEPRSCEALARRLLRNRASSVFTPPLRPALQCSTYAEASALNFALSGRKLSRQAWGIAGKIREVDAFLSRCKTGRGRLRESHPEVLFATLNADVPMQHPKRTDAGKRERGGLLSTYVHAPESLIAALRRDHPKRAVADDDVLDACVLAVCARLCVDGGIAALPATAERDSLGLPMEMVYPRLPMQHG